MVNFAWAKTHQRLRQSMHISDMPNICMHKLVHLWPQAFYYNHLIQERYKASVMSTYECLTPVFAFIDVEIGFFFLLSTIFFNPCLFFHFSILQVPSSTRHGLQHGFTACHRCGWTTSSPGRCSGRFYAFTGRREPPRRCSSMYTCSWSRS